MDNEYWNINLIVKLYDEKIENNIFERVHRLIFTENAPLDADVNDFITRDTRASSYIFKCGLAWWMPTLDKNVFIRIINRPKPYVNYPIIEKRDELLLDIVKILSNDKPARFVKIFIKPLAEVCTQEQVFELCHGYVYKYTEYKFNPDIELPRDIELVSRNGHIVKIHTHVAVSIGDYLKKIVLKSEWSHSTQITIPCDDSTLEWFVKGAYAGIFEFTANIDKIDAVYTLDFLLVIKKETLYADYMECINALGN